MKKNMGFSLVTFFIRLMKRLVKICYLDDKKQKYGPHMSRIFFVVF